MNKFKNIDQETIKALNQKRIIELLYRNKQLTKQEMAQALNVSIPTVISNVKELIDLGYLDEAGVGESSGGRKPVIVRFLPDARYTFGVTVTKEEIRIILTNLNLDIVAEKVIDMDIEQGNFEAVILEIKKEVDKIIGSNKIPIDKILGIGFSLPGTVNEKKLLLEHATNLGLKNICFKDYEQYFNFPIFIENEANASAHAEAFINYSDVKSSLVFISITEGVGAGIIIGDNLYKGYNKHAGEFGHMTIIKDGEQCTCGKKGCWELYASRRALIKKYNKEFNTKDKNLNSLMELAETNEKVREILDDYLEYLAEGIKNIILMFDPENIIIGGEISHYKDLIKDNLIGKIFGENNLFDEDTCKISFSILEGNAPILGAALLPMEKLFFITEKVI